MVVAWARMAMLISGSIRGDKRGVDRASAPGEVTMLAEELYTNHGPRDASRLRNSRRFLRERARASACRRSAIPVAQIEDVCVPQENGGLL